MQNGYDLETLDCIIYYCLFIIFLIKSFFIKVELATDLYGDSCESELIR